ncbi:MAG: tail fiber domain-containing protein [Betaproteobacteria bacterium]
MRTRFRSEKRVAQLEAGDRRHCSLDLFDSPPPPNPNPGMIANAEASEKVGLESIALGREQLAEAKRMGNEQLALSKDLGSQYLSLAKKQGDDQLAFAKPVADEQLATMREARSRGTDQWNQYLSTFKPVEERMAKEAMEYDSPAEMDRRAQQAGAEVNKQYDAAGEHTKRELLRMGVNPNSSQFMAATMGLDTAKARDTAGAMNTAREGVRDRAIALRSGVAAFGRNQPNMAGQMAGVATGAGSAAAGTMGNASNSAVQMHGNASNAYASNMGAATNAHMANTGLPTQWTAGGVGAIGQAGNIYAADFNSRMQGYNAQQQAQAGLWGGLGTAGGMIAAAKITSDPKKKRDIKDVSDADVLEEIKRVPVKRFRYKEGVADSGAVEHTGVMADTAKEEMGVGDGESIPMQDMIGKSVAAVRGLAKQVDRLDRRVAKMAARGIA